MQSRTAFRGAFPPTEETQTFTRTSVRQQLKPDKHKKTTLSPSVFSDAGCAQVALSQGRHEQGDSPWDGVTACLCRFSLAQQPAQLLWTCFPSPMRRNILFFFFFLLLLLVCSYGAYFSQTKQQHVAWPLYLQMSELARKFQCFSSELWVQVDCLFFLLNA